MKHYFKILFSGVFCGVLFFPYGNQIRKRRFYSSAKFNEESEQDLENLEKDILCIKSDFDSSLSKLISR
jgi:cbb3-type cytochrome oxidase subunit 3